MTLSVLQARNPRTYRALVSPAEYHSVSLFKAIPGEISLWLKQPGLNQAFFDLPINAFMIFAKIYFGKIIYQLNIVRTVQYILHYLLIKLLKRTVSIYQNDKCICRYAWYLEKCTRYKISCVLQIKRLDYRVKNNIVLHKRYMYAVIDRRFTSAWNDRTFCEFQIRYRSVHDETFIRIGLLLSSVLLHRLVYCTRKWDCRGWFYPLLHQPGLVFYIRTRSLFFFYNGIRCPRYRTGCLNHSNDTHEIYQSREKQKLPRCNFLT